MGALPPRPSPPHPRFPGSHGGLRPLGGALAFTVCQDSLSPQMAFFLTSLQNAHLAVLSVLKLSLPGLLRGDSFAQPGHEVQAPAAIQSPCVTAVPAVSVLSVRGSLSVAQ